MRTRISCHGTITSSHTSSSQTDYESDIPGYTSLLEVGQGAGTVTKTGLDAALELGSETLCGRRAHPDIRGGLLDFAVNRRTEWQS